ncbi:hypothetical protein ACF0H5_013379 [Mactra antiquata]
MILHELMKVGRSLNGPRARQKFGKYIRSIDYLGAKGEYEDSDEDPSNQLIEYERQCNQDDTFSFDELQDAHAAFREKVCIAEFPGRHSPAYWVAYSTACVIERLTSDFEDDDDKLKTIGNQHVYTWLALLRARPCSAHLDLMSKFVSNQFEKYIQDSKDEEICNILKQMMIKFEYHSSEVEDERTYSSFLKDRIKGFFETMTEEQCQKPKIQLEIIKVSMHYQQQLPTLTSELAQYVGYILSSIVRMFPDKKMYKNCKDIEMMKSHIKILQDGACTFDGDMETLETEQTLSDIIHAAMEGKFVHSIFPNLMTFITQYAGRKTPLKNGERLYRAYKNDLFRKLNATNTKVQEMFSPCVQMITSFLRDKMNLEKHQKEMLSEALGCEIFNIQNLTPDNAKELVKLFGVMVGTGRVAIAKAALRYLSDNERNKTFKKVFEWKNLLKETVVMFETIGDLTCNDMEMTRDDYDEFISTCTDIVEKMLEYLRKSKLLDLIQTAQVKLIFKCISVESPLKARIAAEASSDKYLTVKCTDKDLVTDILEHVNNYIHSDNVTLDNYTKTAITNIMFTVLHSYQSDSDNLTNTQNDLLIKIFTKCSEGSSPEDRFFGQDDDDDDQPSLYYQLYSGPLMLYIVAHAKTKTLKRCEPMIKEVLRWAKIATEEDHEDIASSSMNMLQLLGIGITKDLAGIIPDVLELFLVLNDVSTLLHLLLEMYSFDPEIYHKRLNDIINKMIQSEDNIALSIGTLLERISAKHPQAYDENHVNNILDFCSKAEASRQSVFFQIVRQVATQCPQAVQPHLDKIMNDKMFASEAMIFRIMILGCIANHDQACSKKVIDYAVSHLHLEDPMVRQQILNQILMLAEKNREYLEQYMENFECVESSSNSPEIQKTCRNIINVIEGKSIEGVIEDIQQAQDDIAGLDYKVGKTMTTVVSLGDHVIKQGKEIDDVKKDVEDLEEKVEQVEEDLGETKIKVEDIDNKTLSSAPKWSRDLTKLLNPEDKHDWRLLAKRLGYSNDDIKAWAQQHDPCMAMINEWYTTHKSSEATHGLLNNLQEMERADCVAIVENAMKIVEGVVEDEEFEYPTPPPIFISYQWGIQNEVKLLKQHLNMAGYECWMDIGQMGGGDNLFKKIDNGVRGAKVIICCTTEKYAKSPNCNREVNLSVNLGKPIIPLLMEKMSWPPQGSMGPIFSEYLFIRFFQRPGEETKDQRYWPVPKFQELLMQLNFFVAPDPKMLHSDYDKWWIPIQEEIKIPSKNNTNKVTINNTSDNKAPPTESTSPELFLSYQWGRQVQVKALYDRLTGLGYTVWMDIFQMGGGDSLYDKIDRGIRGCKVVISCVTPKYALSANCRREISLADALKKPIIPLLLEQMKWPPEGPMSMVFTEVLYVNMYRDPDIQKSWSGKNFDEFISKVNEHFPMDITDVPKAEETKPKLTPKSGNAGSCDDAKKEENGLENDGSKAESVKSIKPTIEESKKEKAIVASPPTAKHTVPEKTASDGQKKSKSCVLL